MFLEVVILWFLIYLGGWEMCSIMIGRNKIIKVKMNMLNINFIIICFIYFII